MKTNKKLIILCVLVITGIMLFALSACEIGGLTVTFDAGEYGVIDGELTQTFKHNYDIVYPEVTAKEGYVFTGFSPMSGLPKRGKITIKAQYVKPEFRFVDMETGEYLEEGYRVRVPHFGSGAGSVLLPKIEVQTTDVQSGEIKTTRANIMDGINIKDAYENGVKIENDFPIAVEFKIEENDFFRCEINYLFERDSSRFDWEANLKIKVNCGINLKRELSRFLSDKLSAFKEIELEVFKEHLHVTAIEIISLGSVSSDGVNWYSGDNISARAGYSVQLEGIIEYEDGNKFSKTHIYNLVVERIWSIHGDEILPENFDLYAYHVPLGEHWAHIQLTNLVANGWHVDVVSIQDGVRSNTYTIAIF